MSQFYAKADDEYRCRRALIGKDAITITGLTMDGKIAAFTGQIQSIEAGHTAQALRQLALMLDVGAPPEKILGQLGWLVRTKFPVLARAGLAASIEAVFRTDLNLKRSAGDPRVLLERLVVELCAGRGSGYRRA